MSVAFWADQYRVAIFEEAPGGGDPANINSPINRPILNPLGWLSYVKFHSDLNYYGVAAFDLAKVIAHAAIAGANTQVSYALTVPGLIVRTNHHLITHNLGYVPKFFVVYDGKLVPNCVPVQNDGVSLKRFVSAYATTTEIRLFEIGYSSTTTLPAANRTYQVFVFRNSVRQAGLPMLQLSPSDVIYGQGKFRSADAHLRVVGQGDSPLAIALSRTAGVRNGALRAWLPNGGAVDLGTYTGNVPPPAFVNLALGV